MGIKNHRDFEVWNRAMDLGEEIYRLTKLLPDEEKYAMSSQLRRASISVPSNIAEGKERHSDREFLHFLNFAGGSVAELDTQLRLGVRVGLFTECDVEKALDLCTHVKMMLNALIRRISSDL
ncbi:MAG: four helix bundle protein [Acidaminococcus sp.]|jgi:four helix bundle protein|nr:four helix bundle protein [Acidaminococcus sp.]MCI2099818.1 four helix bundle protein [Acidaminococcus sp.]MCI2114046.1 four helix bundle protein [Acidaminococcus sp.]MCI2115916.1 four helix bundle protein [Acidaminococcus sp.]